MKWPRIKQLPLGWVETEGKVLEGIYFNILQPCHILVNNISGKAEYYLQGFSKLNQNS